MARVYRENGFLVDTLDLDPKWKATYTVDVLDWDYRIHPPGYYHTITCAPPCTEFSTAKTVGVRNLELADSLVQKALEIISYYQPVRWWMENPRGGLLKTRPYMKDIPYIDVDYCQYALWGYKKPTRIWGSPDITLVEGKLCDGYNCLNLLEAWPHEGRSGKRRHRIQLSTRREYQPPRDMKYRIPERLVWELAQFDSLTTPATRAVEARTGFVGVEAACNAVEKGSARQLVMRLKATTCMSREVWLDVLIDTGAEANLIRGGLLRPEEMRRSARPLLLRTADGSRMQGGAQEVALRLAFQGGPEGEQGWSVVATFHDADIQVDAIIGLPWLKAQQLGVFPHLEALARWEEPRRLLHSFQDTCQRQIKRTRKRANRRQQLWAHVARARAMNMTLPGTVDEWEKEEEDPDVYGEGEDSLFEDEDALMAWAEGWKKVERRRAEVQGVVLVPEGEHLGGEDVAARVAALHRDYDGKVLRDRIWGEEVVRGPDGWGHIELKPGAEPVCRRPIPLTGERYDAMVALVDEWVRDNKVENGRGPWSSPAFVVAKKGGKWRGVVDFRSLNEATIRDSHPLPRIEDILVRQGRRHLFSVMDLKDAFHQVPLHHDSRPYTCTSTPRGTKQWKVVVMGLKNGVAIFQRVIEYCLEEVRDVADPYVDDIIVGTEWKGSWEATVEAHEKDLRRVLEKLAHHKMVVDGKKCKFFVKEVEFCGHVLGNGQRRPAPGKLMALEKWEVPRTVTALRGFLGFTNYYSTYVPGYAELAAVLMEKLKVNKQDGKKGSRVRVNFGADEHAAFQAIKERLAAGLRLQTVNPDQPYILRVDASGRAVGAALEQFTEPWTSREMPSLHDLTTRKTMPVAFCSRKLTAGQVNGWSPREKETYAIVTALNKWASWIGPQPVLVLTDHKSLEAWAHEVLDTPSGPAGRRARWHELLSKFDVHVQYIPGKDNIVADALSRWAYPASKAFTDTSIHGGEVDEEEMLAIMEEERQEERECTDARTLEDLDLSPIVRTTQKSKGKSKKKPSTVRVMTRSGRRTEEDPAQHGLEGKEEDVQVLGNPEPAPTGPVPDSPAQGRGGVVQEEAAAAPTPEDDSPRRRVTVEASGSVQGSQGDEIAREGSDEEEIVELSGTSPRGLQPQDVAPSEEPTQPVMERDWEEAYRSCPTYGPKLREMEDAEKTGQPGLWPAEYQRVDGKIYHTGLLCIPSRYAGEVLRAQHTEAGHPTIEGMWRHMARMFEFASKEDARRLNGWIHRSCETCQVSDPNRTPFKCPVEFTPVQPYLMNSVAIDLVFMPETTCDGQTYDIMALCVDRESGWIVATPHLNKGLTAEKVAREMYKQWSFFGIPSVVTSDRGSHFTSGWWTGLCAALGVRVAYGQAYHHQANGKAENSAQQVMRKLTKVITDEGLSWVELLPRVLRHIHDLPGPSGYTPYQVLFGRERPLANVPLKALPTSGKAMDMADFITHMREVDDRVVKALSAVHAQKAREINARRKDPPPFAKGAKVWFQPERQPGTDKLEPRWKGPAVVLAREGQNSYVVQLKPGAHHKAHRSQLKHHVEDTYHGQPVPLYYFSGRAPELEAATDEWRTKEIRGHRKGKDGELEFLVLWEEGDPTKPSWHPWRDFVYGVNSDILRYCREKRVPLEVSAWAAASNATEP